jgi:AhpD family alkylhydroperoxidase
MPLLTPVDRNDAQGDIQVAFDAYKARWNLDFVGNFWTVLARDPPLFRRVWSASATVMQDGEIPRLFKEMLYLAVSVSNSCSYCIHSHTAFARKLGMTDAMYSEFLSVIGLANQNNHLATALAVEVDAAFRAPLRDKRALDLSHSAAGV